MQHQHKKENPTNKPVSYVILRSGKRVSNMEYRNREDASTELEYWITVVKKWDPTAKVEVGVKDSRKHRVY